MAHSPRKSPPVKPEPLHPLLQARQDGWCDGAPARVTLRSVAVDAHTAGQIKCPGCGAKGMKFIPLQRCGDYMAFALCSDCGETEEL